MPSSWFLFFRKIAGLDELLSKNYEKLFTDQEISVSQVEDISADILEHLKVKLGDQMKILAAKKKVLVT